MRWPVTALLTLVAVTSGVAPTHAAWPHDPNNGNVIVSAATGSQSSPQAVSDGAGGIIVTWYDYRSGGADIYAQRIGADGTARWTANGVAVCAAGNEQYYPAITADGAGGAIITWWDYRNGANFDVYAQKIDAAGAVQWTANGVALCTAASDQSSQQLVSDGAGGAIITWRDQRGGANTDVYAQRINSAGAAQWTADGVALCTAANDQHAPVIAADGAGGAIVTWYDYRSGSHYDIYAQRISASGSIWWTANGVGLCTIASDQTGPLIVSDGAGGAIVSWIDYRSTSNYDVYAQRVSASGAAQWAAGGALVCDATGNQYYPYLASDGAGGAILCWADFRGGVNGDIYAQRLSAAGVAQWTANGAALCTATDGQEGARVAADGSGGAVVAWQDHRSGYWDVYAQRISGAGAIQWTSNGAALCTALGNQDFVNVVPDGTGGAIVAWRDMRVVTNHDIYAQRIERYGQLGNPEPVITRVQDLPNDQGGYVKVSWDASYLDADPTYGVYEYRVFRSAAGPLASGVALRRPVTEDSDAAVREGALLVRSAQAGATVYWEYVGTQAAEAFAGYSRVVATTADSVDGGNPRTWYMVEARASTSVSSDRWASAPDSGYSVDNLAPAQPAPFTGQYVAGTTFLHWNRNTEADLAGYRLYRGSSAGFVPGPGNLVATPSDTGYADAAGAPHFYKLTAVDVHGNESPVTTLLPDGTLDVGGTPVPVELSFAAPTPNPAGVATTLRYGLPRAAEVRLEVYDAMGRLVRRVASGSREAGAHTASWDLRDAAGRAVGAGLYFARLEVAGRVLARRIAVAW